jgi:hypothetical protein
MKKVVNAQWTPPDQPLLDATRTTPQRCLAVLDVEFQLSGSLRATSGHGRLDHHPGKVEPLAFIAPALHKG